MLSTRAKEFLYVWLIFMAQFSKTGDQSQLFVLDWIQCFSIALIKMTQIWHLQHELNRQNWSMLLASSCASDNIAIRINKLLSAVCSCDIMHSVLLQLMKYYGRMTNDGELSLHHAATEISLNKMNAYLVQNMMLSLYPQLQIYERLRF